MDYKNRDPRKRKQHQARIPALAAGDAQSDHYILTHMLDTSYSQDGETDETPLSQTTPNIRKLKPYVPIPRSNRGVYTTTAGASTALWTAKTVLSDTQSL
jgi:hypothetical protein